MVRDRDLFFERISSSPFLISLSPFLQVFCGGFRYHGFWGCSGQALGGSTVTS